MMSHITDLYFHISHTWKTSFPEIFLTFSWRRPLSYRNQSIDWIFLHSELKKNKPASIYWQGKYNRSKRKNINISRQFEHQTQYKRKYFYDAICVSSIKTLRRIVDVIFHNIKSEEFSPDTYCLLNIFSIHRNQVGIEEFSPDTYCLLNIFSIHRNQVGIVWVKNIFYFVTYMFPYFLIAFMLYQWNYIYNAIWLPDGKVWAIVEGITTIARC